MPKLAFIGAGKLAGSVIRGLLLKQVCQPGDIVVSEPNAAAREQLQRDLGIGTAASNAEATAAAPAVFLGTKPQVVLPALRELGDAADGKLVVSFAAGIRIAQIEAATRARVMRVMTNTPGAVGRAATAFASGIRTTAADRTMIRQMFGAIGVAVEVTDDEIDGVTALAGSGPAFVYRMIEALARGGERTGLTRESALMLAAQTALGAAELALTSGKSPEELVGQVVTPGGTTAAGLALMKERSVADAISAAVCAAAERGREMSRELA